MSKRIRTIRVYGAPPKKGYCPKRPTLDGSQGNPMAFCQFKRGHKGKHSWQKATPEGPQGTADVAARLIVMANNAERNGGLCCHPGMHEIGSCRDDCITALRDAASALASAPVSVAPKPFSVLREQMSPEAQARSAAKAQELLHEASVATGGAQEHEHCHDLVCNGNRAFAVGVPGHGCSCFSRERRERLAPPVPLPDAAPSPWRDIASAPLATNVLVYFERYREIHVAIQAGQGRWRRPFGQTLQVPTHWMPLPDPPASASPAPKEEA